MRVRNVTFYTPMLSFVLDIMPEFKLSKGVGCLLYVWLMRMCGLCN